MKLLRNHATGISIFALFATLAGLSIVYYLRETKKREEAEANQQAFETRRMMRKAS